MASSENVKGIQIQIGGDTTPLYNALNEASKKTKELESQLVDLNKSLKLNPQNVELIQKKFDVLSKIVDSCSDEVDTLRKGLSSAEMKFKNGEITEEQFNQIAKSTEQAEKKLKFYQDQFDEFKKKEGLILDLNKKLVDIAEKHEEAREEFHKYNEELSNTDFQKAPEKWRETKQKQDEARQSMEDLHQEMEDTREEINKTKQELDQGASAMQTFAEKSSDAGSGMDDFDEGVSDAEAKVGDLKKAVTEGGVSVAVMNEAFKLLKEGLQQGLKALQDYASKLYPFSEALQESAKADQDFLKSIKEQKRELKTNATMLDVQKKRILELNTSILASNKAHKDSAKNRTQLKIEVDKLNESLGEEVFHIDESTGALKESNKAVIENIDAYKRKALIQYELNAYIEAYARYQDGVADLEQKNVYWSNIANNSYQQKERAVEDLNREFQRHEKAYQELIDQEAEYEAETNKYTTGAMKLTSENIDKMISKVKEYRDKNAEYYNSVYSKIKDTNKAINDISETSLAERLEILKKNGQAILNYESNLAYLRTLQMQTMNGDQKEALDEMIRLLSDGSEESMQILNLLVDDFKEKGGETAWAYIQEFTRKDIPGSIYNVGTQTIKSFAQGMRDTQSSLMRVADEIAAKLRQKFQKKFTIKEVHGGAGMYVTDMAQGGIVTKPTYIRAGELGAEAILPLDKLAGIITQTMNRGNGVTGGTAIMNVYPQSMSASQQEMLFKKFDRMMGQSTSTQEVG